MASGRHKKTVISPPCDIISDLPVNIIEIILVCLPLRDVVRTSILSRKWRYNWVRIPRLVFDDTFFRGLKNSSENKLMMTIYEVLLLHRGPILKFTLSVPYLKSPPKIDQLIHFLSRKGVEKITLAIGLSFPCTTYERCKLPLSFFSCLQLRRLTLHNCVFEPPLVFNGFSKLISLSFSEVDFDADLIGEFISNCPLLEKLTLVSIDIESFGHLELDASALKSLDISSSFNSIGFKNTPLLESLEFFVGEAEDLEQFGEAQTSRMIEVFGSIPVIKNLRVDHGFIKFLTLGGVPEKLPFTLNHLKYLELYNMRLCERDEASLALCMIKSSPNLEKIRIEVEHWENADEGPVLELLEVQDYSDFSLNQLENFVIFHDARSRPAIEFFNLILANSPLLERVDAN